MRHIIYGGIILLFFANACKEKNRFVVDISNIDLQIESTRFDRLVHELDTSHMTEAAHQLRASLPYYYDLFCQGIIQIGPAVDPNNAIYLKHFLNDSIYRQVFDTVQVHFANTSTIEKEIIDGLKRFHVLFASKASPDLFFHISGFNESIIIGQDVLSISLDNYLGKDHPFYEWLGIYAYKRAQKIPERIAPDALMAWASTEIEANNSQHRLLDEMIYQGKLAFLIQQLLPEKPLHLILGITKEHMTWCEQNEARIWTAMIEWKHLFSKDQSTINKHLKDAPFNSFYGDQSSPKSGIYIGWKIVTEFMDTNPEQTLEQLFQISDGQLLLQQSNYRP